MYCRPVQRGFAGVFPHNEGVCQLSGSTSKGTLAKIALMPMIHVTDLRLSINESVLSFASI